jgi:hypothetical protein
MELAIATCMPGMCVLYSRTLYYYHVCVFLFQESMGLHTSTLFYPVKQDVARYLHAPFMWHGICRCGVAKYRNYANLSVMSIRAGAYVSAVNGRKRPHVHILHTKAPFGHKMHTIPLACVYLLHTWRARARKIADLHLAWHLLSSRA